MKYGVCLWDYKMLYEVEIMIKKKEKKRQELGGKLSFLFSFREIK